MYTTAFYVKCSWELSLGGQPTVFGFGVNLSDLKI